MIKLYEPAVVSQQLRTVFLWNAYLWKLVFLQLWSWISIRSLYDCNWPTALHHTRCDRQRRPTVSVAGTISPRYIVNESASSQLHSRPTTVTWRSRAGADLRISQTAATPLLPQPLTQPYPSVQIATFNVNKLVCGPMRAVHPASGAADPRHATGRTCKESSSHKLFYDTENWLKKDKTMDARKLPNKLGHYSQHRLCAKVLNRFCLFSWPNG